MKKNYIQNIATIIFFCFYICCGICYAEMQNAETKNAEDLKFRATELNNEALALSGAGNYAAAIEKLEEACSIYSQDKLINNNLIMVINNYAASISETDQRLATELYEKGISLPDAPYNIHMNYGAFLAANAKYEEAGFQLEKALGAIGSDKKDETHIRNVLGDVYLKRGFFDEAITVLEPAANNSHSPDSYYLLGKTYYTQSKFANAIESLELAVKYGKNNVHAQAANELLQKVKKEAKVESKFQSQSLYHFQIQFDGDKRSDVKVDKVSQYLEEAYNEVGSYFNFYPEAPTQVIIYSQQQFKEASDSPIWVAGLYDGKIRIPLNDVIANADELKRLILHEYTHAVIFQLSRGYCPIWLNEGFAQTLEGNGLSDKQTANLKKQLSKKEIFTMKSLEGSFMGISPVSAVALAYDQSLSFTAFLIEKLGQSQLIEALPLLSQGKTMAQILEENFYTNYDKLQADWLDIINKY